MTDEEQLLKTGDSGIDKSKATSIALDKKATGRDIVAAWIAQLGKIEEADEELVAAIEKHLNRIQKVDEAEAEKKKAEAKNDKES
jgi:hypothetical protein